MAASASLMGAISRTGFQWALAAERIQKSDERERQHHVSERLEHGQPPRFTPLSVLAQRRLGIGA
jgi:hypothetical protein